MRILKYIAYIVIQCTWGIVQTFAGFILYLMNINSKHTFYHGSIRTQWPKKSGVSLGLFIFVSMNKEGEVSEKMSLHEYGHTFQSLMLGPLYLFVIGIPSFIWCHFFQVKRKRERIPYSAFAIEGWADELGAKTIQWMR